MEVIKVQSKYLNKNKLKASDNKKTPCTINLFE